MELCPYVCNNKTEYGYCKTTACINPKYSSITLLSNSLNMVIPGIVVQEYLDKQKEPDLDKKI